MTRRQRSLSLAILAIVAALLLVGPQPVGAQEDDTSRSDRRPSKADIEFVVGDYSASIGDWPVTAIELTADIEDNTTFSVILHGGGGRELWRVETQFYGPTMTIPVDGVAVGEVVETELSSNLVAGALVVPQLDDNSLQGGGGSTGQIATTLSLVIIVAVILFRTPLPAAATQRWTK